MDLRRTIATNQIAARQGDPPPARWVMSTSSHQLRPEPTVSVIMALYNHRGYVAEALDSLLRSSFGDWEVVVVDDGSTDGSGSEVSAWAAAHPEVRLLLLEHPVNRGLGQARNTALDHARGEYAFVLDSDNAVYPNALQQLVTLLDARPEASFAYGVLASFRDGKPQGLLSFFPWEPRRLRVGNYIDAMALFRTQVLRSMGGYSTDRRLYGWEDYDLYCRLAEAGHEGAYAEQFVAWYRSSPTSMLMVTNISHSSAWAAIKEHSPNLMGLVKVPD